jgi:hypothetical protein
MAQTIRVIPPKPSVVLALALLCAFVGIHPDAARAVYQTVNVVASPPLSVQLTGAGATACPTAPSGSGACKVHVENTPTVNQGTSPWVVNTPAPFSGLVTQGTSPWIVNTPAPFSGLVTQGTSPWIVNTPAPFSGLVTQGTSPWVVTTPAPFNGVVSGTVSIGNFPATQPVSLASANRCASETPVAASFNLLAANTQIITGTASTTTICGLYIDNVVATTSTQLTQGTGTVCGTGNSLIFPQYTGVIGSVILGFAGQQIITTIPPNTNVCAFVGGAGANASIHIAYVVP